MRDTPPVTEVALSIQFEGLGELTVLDYADFFEQFKSDFPVLQQVAPSSPMVVDDALNQIPQVQLLGKPDMPRIWCVSSDSHFLIQFQNDRLSFNWRRMTPVTDPEEYPGYLEICSRFTAIYDKTRRWVADRLAQEIKPSVGELMYIDVVPMTKPDGTKRRLSDVFTFYKPANPPRTVSGFQCGWREALSGPLRGRVQMLAFVTVQADGTPAAAMQFTSRIDLKGATGEPESWFNQSHNKILDMFQNLLISDPEDT